MSLLQSIVTEVIKNAAQSQQSQQQAQGGLGGLLGGLAGAMSQGQSNQGMGGVLGGVLGSVLGGQSSQAQGLDAILGGLLGGQKTNASPTDLGGILASVLGGGNQGAQGGMNKSALLLALLPIVLTFIQKNGGLSGVLGKFSSSGMNNQAQSWVNIDTDNDGIDAGDIQRLFGESEIQAACAQTGASQDQVCQGIAELLPQVMNDLTPQGDLSTEQEANDEIAQILAQIKANKY
ncbi:YidB family protein [Moraxella sp. FZLJ2107]|uniref:YidB family protein n=1 Tax=unclassified Moraxella TaxID=2685852 RepID=UPI0020C85E37|nr:MULTISPECIES: YidB family protein [unclassified Moraxella]UTO05280.1 YidB family protein [Moraxella sp. FZLJ2107]UTO22015.1 YidB family protein [Moraxella sp. FZLJ2109]